MAQKLRVKGYQEVKKVLGQFASSDHSAVYVLFCGSKDDKGNSWCPDCVAAEPVVEEALTKIANKDAVFIHCEVGDRAYWKDQSNEFRKDEEFHLTCVPTLIKWKTPQRLEESQCQDLELVSMLFED